LEQGLLVGAALALVGVLGNGWVFWNWSTQGFGQLPVEHVRHVIFWSLCFFVGVQIFFSSFFLSMLGINRRTYIGDPESE
jgi:hypothetical protein